VKTNLRTLGPKEAITVLTFREQGRNVVCAEDVIELLAKEQTARKVIRNLLKKGWLIRLVAGRYLFLPPEHGSENLGENNPLAIASAVVEPSYIGWWAAASFHGLTTQKPTIISVATRRSMSPRTIEGNEIRVPRCFQWMACMNGSSWPRTGFCKSLLLKHQKTLLGDLTHK
jgi:predicted transcriptional regulator of viral defense system